MKIAAYTKATSTDLLFYLTEAEVNYLFSGQDEVQQRCRVSRKGDEFWITRADSDDPKSGPKLETFGLPDRQGYVWRLTLNSKSKVSQIGKFYPEEFGRTIVKYEKTVYNDRPAFYFKWKDIEFKPLRVHKNKGKTHLEVLEGKLKNKGKDQQPKRSIREVEAPKDPIAKAAFGTKLVVAPPQPEPPPPAEIPQFDITSRSQLRGAIDTINDMIRRKEAIAHLDENGLIVVQIVRIENL